MVQQLHLTKDMVALVDDHDLLSVVSKVSSWHATKAGNKWYAAASLPWTEVSGRWVRPKLYLHRFIAKATSPKVLVDHYDGNGMNCTRDNLMTCGYYWNNHNRDADIGELGYRGVTRKRGRFRARIGYMSTVIYCGLFDTPQEAAQAYDLKAIELYGPLARTNLREGRLAAHNPRWGKIEHVKCFAPSLMAEVPF